MAERREIGTPEARNGNPARVRPLRTWEAISLRLRASRRSPGQSSGRAVGASRWGEPPPGLLISPRAGSVRSSPSTAPPKPPGLPNRHKGGIANRATLILDGTSGFRPVGRASQRAEVLLRFSLWEAASLPRRHSRVVQQRTNNRGFPTQATTRAAARCRPVAGEGSFDMDGFLAATTNPPFSRTRMIDWLLLVANWMLGQLGVGGTTLVGRVGWSPIGRGVPTPRSWPWGLLAPANRSLHALWAVDWMNVGRVMNLSYSVAWANSAPRGQLPAGSYPGVASATEGIGGGWPYGRPPRTIGCTPQRALPLPSFCHVPSFGRVSLPARRD